MELTLRAKPVPRALQWLMALIQRPFERWREQSVRTETRSAAFRIRAGELLDAYGNSILRLAYSYLHNRSDAEEVLREAYDFEETVR